MRKNNMFDEYARKTEQGQLYVWVDQDFARTPWYIEFYQGVKAALLAKHLKTQIYIGDNFPVKPKPGSVFVLGGNSYKWYYKALAFIKEYNSNCCVVGCEVDFESEFSSVTADYVRNTYQLVNYMYGIGHSRIALFGSYRTSPHDQNRIQGYLKAIKQLDLPLSKDDIYYIEDNVENSVNIFMNKRQRYDAIITCNDLIAFYLITRLSQSGVSIPEDICIASHGNTVLSQVSRPTISSISINLRESGIQAVKCSCHLLKSPGMIRYSSFVESTFYPRQSTGCIPFNATGNTFVQNLHGFPQGMPSDQCMAAIAKLEKIFQDDKNDEMQIIAALFSESPLSDISDKLFISQSALNYRLGKIYGMFGVNGRGELRKLLENYTSCIDFGELIKIKAESVLQKPE